MGYKVIEEYVNISEVSAVDVNEFMDIIKGGISLNDWLLYYRQSGKEINKDSDSINAVIDVMSNIENEQQLTLDSDTQTLTRISIWPSEIVYNDYNDIRNNFPTSTKAIKTFISAENI